MVQDGDVGRSRTHLNQTIINNEIKLHYVSAEEVQWEVHTYKVFLAKLSYQNLIMRDNQANVGY